MTGIQVVLFGCVIESRAEDVCNAPLCKEVFCCLLAVDEVSKSRTALSLVGGEFSFLLTIKIE